MEGLPKLLTQSQYLEPPPSPTLPPSPRKHKHTYVFIRTTSNKRLMQNIQMHTNHTKNTHKTLLVLIS